MDYKFINPEYIDSVSGGDNAIITELIDLFRDQVAETYTQMVSLLAEKKFYDLGLLAHKIKSSVAIMGMSDLAIMLKTFEINAKEGKGSEEYNSFILRFKNDTLAALEELDSFVKSRKI